MLVVSVLEEGDTTDKPKGDGEAPSKDMQNVDVIHTTPVHATKQLGFSVVEKLESAIAVGTTFGWEHTLESIIAEKWSLIWSSMNALSINV
ncbi:hypothetical protein Tco_0463495 [Tanacetum coccineum]